MLKKLISNFVVYLAAILVVVVGATNYWVYIDSKALLQQNMEVNAHAKLNSTVNVSAYYFRQFEYELINAHVQRVSAEEGINYIRVFDATGSTAFSAGQENIEHSRRFSEDIIYEGELIGHVTLDLDATKFYRDVNNVLARSLISFIISITLIGSLVYFFFKYVIVSQIEKARKEKEKLEEEHGFITSVIDTSSHMVLVLDHSGNVVLNNKTCSEETGVCLKDSIGRPVWDFLDIRCDESELKEFLSASNSLSKSRELKKVIEGHCVSNISVDDEEKVIEWRFNKLSSSEGGVKYIIGIGIDVTRHHLEHEQLKDLAHRDNLTSLPNRYMFQKSLDAAVQREVQTGEGFSLLYIDLDNFKPINDTLGHDAGDFVLQTVANRLQDTLRTTDTVARLGGDEFAALLANINDTKCAEIVAQKIIDAMTQPIIYGEKSCQIGASIGVALYPLDSDDLEQLIKHADNAMYQAKQSGKNTYCFFSL